MRSRAPPLVVSMGKTPLLRILVGAVASANLSALTAAVSTTTPVPWP